MPQIFASLLLSSFSSVTIREAMPLGMDDLTNFGYLLRRATNMEGASAGVIDTHPKLVILRQSRVVFADNRVYARSTACEGKATGILPSTCRDRVSVRMPANTTEH
jgi:hypothetical protein